MKIIVDETNKKFINFLKKNSKEKLWLIIIWDRWIWKTFLTKNLIEHDYWIDEAKFMQYQKNWEMRLKKYDEFSQDSRLFPLEMLSKAPIIIYDDFWTAAINETYITNTLYWLNRRLEKWLKTVITTNLSEKDILTRETRIWSRLFELWLIIQLNWPDRRVKNSRKITL